MGYDGIEPHSTIQDYPIFTNAQLDMISHALYQTYNKLGYTSNISEQEKEKSAEIQREINSYLKSINFIR